MQDCDVTLKTLLSDSAETLLRQAGVTCAVAKWHNVELPRVQNRRVDLLAELASGELLHIELQSGSEPDMPLRMLEYAVGIWRRYGRFPGQLILYVGNGRMNIARATQSAGLNFRYDVVDVRDMDGEALVESEFLSDNILAVLARTDDKASVIRRIIGKIGRLEPGRREDAIRKLLILSGMRGLEKTVTEERNRVPVTFDIMDNEVLGPAIRQGLEQGLAEGREQGLAEGSRRLLRVLLEKRFGMLPAWAHQRLASCTDSQTDDLALRLLDAGSLESLFCQPETY